MHWFKIRINEKTSYFLYYIINLTRLPLNVSNSLHQKFIFPLLKFSWPFFFSFLSLLFGHKKRKLFWLVRGCWSILIGCPIDFHMSMGISNSQILIWVTSYWPPNQNIDPGHLRTWISFLDRIFAWVVNMTHSQFVFPLY